MSFKQDRGPTKVTITPANADAASSAVYWYDKDELFIEQTEKETGVRHLILIGRSGVEALVVAMQHFLSQ